MKWNLKNGSTITFEEDSGSESYHSIKDYSMRESDNEIATLRAFIGSFFATDEDRLSALCWAEREGGTDMADTVKRAFEEPST